MAEFTKAQKKAIETADKTVLVSAAAGSGKTTTLTERIIRTLTNEENPADIGRFLIVTFTKAAAADLKSKISRALGEALAENPSNRHLSRQMIKLGSADICTIDSFYLRVVKSNFERLGLPARLTMMDESELKVMKLGLLEEVIEYFYETRGASFRGFMDCFMDSRGVVSAAGELCDLYDKKLSGYPDFIEFLIKNAEELEKEATMPFFETRVGLEVKARSLEFFDHCEKVYADALEMIMSDEKATKAYGPSFKYDSEHFALTRRAIENGDYNGAAAAFSGYSKLALGSYPHADQIYNEFRNLRTECIEEYERLGGSFFASSESILSQDALKTADFCRNLYDLLSEFHRRFAEEKISRGGCDFTDNKRFTLKLFIGEDGMPTPLAKEYSQRYDEIYIDEYQDTDLVQDMIFSAISKPNNRFMVGDIKQSIYRFRGANPSVFASYKNTFPDVDSSSESMNCAIYMSENFRCDKPVIDITNRICGFLFEKGPNNIGYTEKDALICKKRTEPEGREMKTVRFSMIRAYTASALAKMTEEEQEKCAGKGGDLEVKAVVSEISRLLSDPNETCEDHGKLRRIEPRDIAILARDNRAANSFAAALAEKGIPCSARTTVNYFENPEVLLVMSLLNVIDNPQKDVYLAGVLRSPLFGFGLGELVEIRKKGEGAISLYDDLIYASVHSESESLREKIAFFLKKLELYREQARLLPVDRLLRFLYSDTLMLSFAGGDDEDESSDINESRANLLLLYDYARRYETGSYKGLYSFICYINDIIASGQTVEPPAASGSSNVVSVMTIHNSKGLEFPICFIVSTHKALGGRGSDIIEFDRELGIGVLFGDESGFARIDNAIRRAIIAKNEREDLEEEMRVLYVAMTRARERLYMSAYSYSDNWEEAARLRAKYADEYSVMSCSSYLQWIAAVYFSMGEEERGILAFERLEPYEIPDHAVKGSDAQFDTEESDKEEKINALFSRISDRFSFEYPYSHLSRLPAKLSVSKLYPEVLDPIDAEEPFNGEVSLRDKPAFLIPKAERASAADRGTATHTFMQFCNFENAEKNGVKEEIARLCEMGLLARETAELINICHVEEFFESGFYRSMKNAMEHGGKLYREQRFNIDLPAAAFTSDEEFKERIRDDKIVVQGVIDLLFIDEKGDITLCDYKTDYLEEAELNSSALAAKKLGERHGLQLSYYSTAVRKIFGKEPSRVCIYSLPFGEALDIRVWDSIE